MEHKYDLAWLKERMENGERLKFVHFWNHEPEFGQDAGPFFLSQWYEAPFEVEGETYKTTEHWMMAHKARLFGDEAMFRRIVDAAKPGEAKDLGRLVSGFDEQTWVDKRVGIVIAGNTHKFGQHEKLRQYLVQTGERILVEASPIDRIWGIGLAQDHPHSSEVDQWQGLNLLGFALMEVRDALK